MKDFAIVYVEVIKDNQTSEFRNVKIAGEYITLPSDEELFSDAKIEIGNPNYKYRLIEVCHLKEEDFNRLIDGQSFTFFADDK